MVKICRYGKVDSTQNVAKELIEEGEEEGLVVIADEQSKGKGRLGRKWISPSDGLYFSVVVKKQGALPLISAVAVAKTLEEFGLRARIKWPNDVLVKNKKIAGIIIELFRNYAIIGIGVNMDTVPLKTSTAIKEQTGKSISKDILLKRILKNFEVEDAFCEYKRLSDTIGRFVRIEMIDGFVEGTAIDIDEHGRLMLKSEGKIRKITSGDCIHLR